MKTLFIVQSGWNSKLVKKLKSLKKNDLLVIWGTYFPKELLEKGWNIKLAEDYLKKKDYHEIDSYIFRYLSSSWYLYQDATKYEDIHLGRIIEYSFQKFLVPRLKNIILLQKIIQSEGIECIVVVDETKEFRECLAFISRSYCILIKHHSFHKYLRLLPSFLNVLKGWCRDSIIKKIDQKENQAHKKNYFSRSAILLDSRLYVDFEKRGQDTKQFIPLLLEDGLRLRLDMKKRKKPYVFFLKEAGISFKNQWGKLKTDEAFRKQFYFGTVNLWPLVEEKLKDLFNHTFPILANNIQFLNQFFKKQKVGLILLRNDLKEFERLLIEVAHQHKISVAVIQHGVWAELNQSSSWADHFLAWGEASRHCYKKQGEVHGNFVIVGNPKFDDLRGWKPSISKKELYSSLNLNPDQKMILWVTQQINLFSSFWTNDLFYMKTRALLDSLKTLKECQLIIKADPYEKIEPYEQILQSFEKKKVSVVRDMNIYTLMYYSDLLITLDSTAALEAFFFEKPVIVFNLTKREDRVPYAQEGAALRVAQIENLPIAINKALYDSEVQEKLKEAQTRFLQKYAYQIDGKAQERISKFMNSYI